MASSIVDRGTGAVIIVEFARQLHNATLGTALGQLQQLRQDRDWKKACLMPKGKERKIYSI